MDLMISKEKILVTLIFSVLAALSLMAAIWGTVLQYRVMSHAAIVPATVDREWYSHGRRYATPHLRVSYSYDGRDYTQSAMLPMWYVLFGQQRGDAVTVTVDSSDPSDAWLASTTADWIGFALTPLFLAAVSAMFGLFGALTLTGKGRVA